MDKNFASTPPVPRFNLRHIRAFLVTAEELHFGLAAERLFMSQPALSRMIRTLERALGLSLFDRSSRRVELTSAGAAFAIECRLAYAHIQRARPAAIEAAAGQRGGLRIGYMNLAINSCLPSLLRTYRESYPQVNIELEYSPSIMQYRSLLEGRIDIGFVIGQFRGQEIQNLQVDREAYVALLPDNHSLTSRESLCLTDLANENFVLGTNESFGTFRQLLFPLCHNADFVPNIVQEASDANGIMGMVAAGAGVSVYGDSARNTKRTGLEIRNLVDINECIPIYAIWSQDNRSTTLLKFTEFLASYVQN